MAAAFAAVSHQASLMVTDGGGSFGKSHFGLKALLDTLAVPPLWWREHRRDHGPSRVRPHGRPQGLRLRLTRSQPSTTRSGCSASSPARALSSPGPRSARSRTSWRRAAASSPPATTRTSASRCAGPFPACGRCASGSGPTRDPTASRSRRPSAARIASTPCPPARRPASSSTISSDAIPQTVAPRLYPSGPSFPYFIKRAHPHPLLCGPNGIIRVLPDHPHEGECIVPSNLAAPFTVDGSAFDVYPVLTGTTRLAAGDRRHLAHPRPAHRDRHQGRGQSAHVRGDRRLGRSPGRWTRPCGRRRNLAPLLQHQPGRRPVQPDGRQARGVPAREREPGGARGHPGVLPQHRDLAGAPAAADLHAPGRPVDDPHEPSLPDGPATGALRGVPAQAGPLRDAARGGGRA